MSHPKTICANWTTISHLKVFIYSTKFSDDAVFFNISLILIIFLSTLALSLGLKVQVRLCCMTDIYWSISGFIMTYFQNCVNSDQYQAPKIRSHLSQKTQILSWLITCILLGQALHILQNDKSDSKKEIMFTTCQDNSVPGVNSHLWLLRS